MASTKNIAATQETQPLGFIPLRRHSLRRGQIGKVILLAIALPCLVTLPWSVSRYEGKAGDEARAHQTPNWSQLMGTDALGRSLLWRALLGGAISLGIGVAAAGIAVTIGVTWGATAGYIGGRTDALMMRTVDVLYGLPYILLVVLVNIALQPVVFRFTDAFLRSDVAAGIADVITLLIAIGGISWLTMARVIRGQVLSLRTLPFIEAARAYGVGPRRMIISHLLPNLIGPIIVYTTLAVPQAILQESFLSFLGIGVQAPLPSWGNLASDGLVELHALGIQGMTMRWWLFVWPCALLGLTLLALNFLGDALRARWDPRSSHL